MNEESEISDNIKHDQGFIAHVFNFDNKSKQDISNTLQYSILAIIPVVILNKTIHRLIPEADENKGSLEISAEILAQIGLIFVGIFFIHRVITYFPTYSEAKYEHFSIINSIISFLIILLSLQTKLGEKMNIIVDRLLITITGTQVHQTTTNNEESMSEYSVPIINNTPSVQQTNNNPQPQMMQEMPIMAANESLGGAFGSSF